MGSLLRALAAVEAADVADVEAALVEAAEAADVEAAVDTEDAEAAEAALEADAESDDFPDVRMIPITTTAIAAITTVGTRIFTVFCLRASASRSFLRRSWAICLFSFFT